MSKLASHIIADIMKPAFSSNIGHFFKSEGIERFQDLMAYSQTAIQHTEFTILNEDGTVKAEKVNLSPAEVNRVFLFICFLRYFRKEYCYGSLTNKDVMGLDDELYNEFMCAVDPETGKVEDLPQKDQGQTPEEKRCEDRQKKLGEFRRGIKRDLSAYP